MYLKIPCLVGIMKVAIAKLECLFPGWHAEALASKLSDLLT